MVQVGSVEVVSTTESIGTTTNTDIRTGLATPEAARRLATAGGRRPPRILTDQFRDWVTVMLLVSAVVVGFAGDWPTAAVFAVFALANVAITRVPLVVAVVARCPSALPCSSRSS